MKDAEAALPNDIALCHELILQQAAAREQAQRRIEQLEHSVDLLLRQRYGPRSERIDPNQLRLFTDQADDPRSSAEREIEPETPAKPNRTWKRRGRQTLPDHLPRVPVIIELPDNQRVCPGCGGLRAHFADEISEQLDYVPASLFVRFWVYHGDSRNPYCAYDFTPSRKRDGPERFLAGFAGYLQADAFAGYDRLCAGAGVIRVACWAHARRRFYEARTTAPLHAHEALARIRQLYRIEDACRDLSAEARREVRQREAVPLLNALAEWLGEQSRSALPKSPIGQAISYALAQWGDLRTYTHDGELSIDNNVSERSLRAQAISRKNYLFVGSDRGGRTAATLYSLVGSCKRQTVDPFAYLKDILKRLPTYPVDPLGELLPDVWIGTNQDATPVSCVKDIQVGGPWQ